MCVSRFAVFSGLLLLLTTGCADRRVEQMQNELHAKAAEAEDQRAEAQAQTAAIQATLAELRVQVENAKSEAASREAEVSRIGEKLAAATQDNNKVLARLQAVENELLIANAELSAAGAAARKNAAQLNLAETNATNYAEKLRVLEQTLAANNTTVSTAAREVAQARNEKYLALKALAESERARAELQKQLADWVSQLATTEKRKSDDASRDADTAEQLMEAAKEKVGPWGRMNPGKNEETKSSSDSDSAEETADDLHKESSEPASEAPKAATETVEEVVQESVELPATEEAATGTSADDVPLTDALEIDVPGSKVPAKEGSN